MGIYSNKDIKETPFVLKFKVKKTNFNMKLYENNTIFSPNYAEIYNGKINRVQDKGLSSFLYGKSTDKYNLEAGGLVMDGIFEGYACRHVNCFIFEKKGNRSLISEVGNVLYKEKNSVKRNMLWMKSNHSNFNVK